MDNSLNNPSASGSTQVPRRFVARHRRLSNDDVARFIHRPNRIENHRQGYPRLSAFINSDRNFALFRGFGQLQARVLLHMQDELAHLEQRLNDLDNNERIAFNLSSSRQDSNGARRGVLTELKSKLEKYNQAMAAYCTHIERRGPRKSKIRNASHWLKGNKPLVAQESGFLTDWDDLRSPKDPSDYGGLERFLEGVVDALSIWGLSRYFVTQV